ncbi:MAG TPA: cold shock domain-containing protein [Stellaceae bacterium]|jgi:CspA family cold shock protein|nr:cold shock domain-containing protein [Stellaceae bacterium]
MGRGNDFREPRRRGFDDDMFTVRESRGGGSRPFPASAPSQAEGPVTEAVVKWFNPEKGFGFVSLSDGRGDAFLHIAVLQAAGHESILPGAKLRGHIGSGAKGFQVARIVEIDESGATAEPQRPKRSSPPHGKQAAPDPSTAVELRGTVKWFSVDKGFGFFDAGDGDKDVFVHISVLDRAGLNSLADGQQVTARVVQTPKGREAISIALA